MTKAGTVESSNPCFAEQTNYDNAVKQEQELLKKQRAARSKLETLKPPAVTFSDGDDLSPREKREKDAQIFRGITQALNTGQWPKKHLGPLDQTSDQYHQYQSTDFMKCAREVYDYWHAYHEALDATAKAKQLLYVCHASESYKKWLRAKSQTSACGAPCTSHGREGKPCGHQLTAKRVCPNHGARPSVASAAA